MALTPDAASLNRDQALFMAKQAEQAERYEDMVAYMKRIITITTSEAPDDLSVEERNLLSVGYKNMMSTRRTAFRTVQSLGDLNASNAEEKAFCDQYNETVSKEVFALIDQVSNDVVKVYTQAHRDGKSIANQEEVNVFFYKMEGDYNRYGAEITEGEQKQTYKDLASVAYQTASEVAKALPSTNPIRLGLALNFSVFHYEICEKKTEATELAKDAFDTAIDHLDTLGDDEYKDSTLIMQLLKDNLTLWNTDIEDEEADIEVEDVE